jgi:hypothetical protein
MIDADMVLSTARLMWSLTLSGRPTAHQTAAHEWMKAIAPGHLVAELTSRSMPALERVGIVDSIDAENDAVTIRCLDGSSKRWVNAEFVRLPRTNQERLEVDELARKLVPDTGDSGRCTETSGVTGLELHRCHFAAGHSGDHRFFPRKE